MGKDHKSVANQKLGDTTYFKRLDRDPASDLQRLLNEKLTEMLASKEISEHNSRKSQSRPILSPPKNHKPGNPGRPIVSANDHPTKRILEFVGLLVSRLPSYVQDTNDYLTKLPQATYQKKHCLSHLMLCANTPTYHL